MEEQDNSIDEQLKSFIDSDYKLGFESDVKQLLAPKGLNEDVVRFISQKKNEPQFLLD